MTFSMVITENGRPVRHDLHELKLQGRKLVGFSASPFR